MPTGVRRVSTPASRRPPARKPVPACKRYLNDPFWQRIIRATGGSTDPFVLLDFLARKSPRKPVSYAPRRPQPQTYLKNVEIRGHCALWNVRPDPRWHGTHVPLYRPGCFARTLEEIRTGQRTVIMGVDHEGCLASTAEGSLTLWEDARGLAFACQVADTPEGRLALEEMRLGRLKGASVWLHRQQPSYRQVHSFVPTVEVFDVSLKEVSLCHEPAVAQTGDSLALYTFDGYAWRRWDAKRRQLAETRAESAPARVSPHYRGHAPVNPDYYRFFLNNPQLFP